MTDYTIRFATLDDVDQITAHRRLMFTDMGVHPLEEIAAMDEKYSDWLHAYIDKGDYVGLLAEKPDGEIIAGAGLWLYDAIPSPFNAEGRGAHVVDVYVYPAHRRQGIARHLMEHLLDWCREQGYKQVTLTASDEGRYLYEKMGFKAANRMAIALDE